MYHDHNKIRVTIRVTFSDKQDDEIQSKSPVECHSQQKRSLTYTCLVLFSSFSTIGVGLKCGVHSHWVFVKSSSKRGLQHNKNSEQVRGNASTQPHGICHDKKSEQAGGKASTQRVVFSNINRSFISARVLISPFDGSTLSSRMAC